MGRGRFKQIQADLTATNYEYLTFIAYACEQVPLRLRSLVKDSGVPGETLEKCASYYEEIRQDIIKQTQTTIEQYPDLASAFQTKISVRTSDQKVKLQLEL